MKTILIILALHTTPTDSVAVQAKRDTVQVIKPKKKKWHRSKKDDCRPSVFLEGLKIVIPALLTLLATK